jgi:hypothetical protein
VGIDSFHPGNPKGTEPCHEAQAVTSFGLVVKSLFSSSLRKLKKAYAHLGPNEEYFLMTFFGFLVVGLYFLGKLARNVHPKSSA